MMHYPAGRFPDYLNNIYLFIYFYSMILPLSQHQIASQGLSFFATVQDYISIIACPTLVQAQWWPFGGKVQRTTTRTTARTLTSSLDIAVCFYSLVFEEEQKCQAARLAVSQSRIKGGYKGCVFVFLWLIDTSSLLGAYSMPRHNLTRQFSNHKHRW